MRNLIIFLFSVAILLGLIGLFFYPKYAGSRSTEFAKARNNVNGGTESVCKCFGILFMDISTGYTETFKCSGIVYACPK